MAKRTRDRPVQTTDTVELDADAIRFVVLFTLLRFEVISHVATRQCQSAQRQCTERTAVSK